MGDSALRREISRRRWVHHGKCSITARLSGKARQHPWPVLLLVCFGQCVFADIYTGTNAHGIRWFSDTPPVTGEPYRQIRQAATHPKTIAQNAAEPPTETLTQAEQPTDEGALSQRPVPPSTDVSPANPVKPARTTQTAARSSAGRSKAGIKPSTSNAAPTSKAAKRSTSRARAQRAKAATLARVTNPQSARRSTATDTRQRRAQAKRAQEAARREKRCQRYEHDLRKIQAQLRAGYTAAQGRKLRMRRSDLKERQFTECPTR